MNANQVLSKLSELNTDLIRNQEIIFKLKFKIQNNFLSRVDKAATYSKLEDAENKASEIIKEAREPAKTLINVTD
jgi:hypothetical protein